MNIKNTFITTKEKLKEREREKEMEKKINDQTLIL